MRAAASPSCSFKCFAALFRSCEARFGVALFYDDFTAHCFHIACCAATLAAKERAVSFSRLPP